MSVPAPAEGAASGAREGPADRSPSQSLQRRRRPPHARDEAVDRFTKAALAALAPIILGTIADVRIGKSLAPLIATTEGVFLVVARPVFRKSDIGGGAKRDALRSRLVLGSKAFHVLLVCCKEQKPEAWCLYIDPFGRNDGDAITLIDFLRRYGSSTTEPPLLTEKERSEWPLADDALFWGYGPALFHLPRLRRSEDRELFLTVLELEQAGEIPRIDKVADRLGQPRGGEPFRRVVFRLTSRPLLALEFNPPGVLHVTKTPSLPHPRLERDGQAGTAPS